jgi:competence protein ComEC
MQQASHSLFPFAFWVSLLISVLFRQYLWINLTKSLQKVQVIRVSDIIVSPDQVNLSKNIIILQGIKITPLENYRYKSETSTAFLGRLVTAAGNPRVKSPRFNFADFTIEDAQIDISGARPSRLTAVKLRFFSLAVSWRAGFSRSLASLYSGREADIMTGVLLGNRDGFPADFSRRLRQSGLMHLAAASGYNISIVVGIFGAAVARISKINVIKVIIVITFILFYIVISGDQASVIRAGLMGAVGFLASLAGSAASIRRLFTAAALSMLLVKPAWLWDLGYQLSVAATAGMIWIVPLFTKSNKDFLKVENLDRLDLDNLKPRLLDQDIKISKIQDQESQGHPSSRFLRKILAWWPLAEPLAASLTTAPILVFNLGWERLSLTAIPANVLATPLVPALMAAAAIASLLGLASPPLGQAAAVLTRPLVTALLLIIDLSATANEKLMAFFAG